ncbi:MAG: BCCT family transporter, partial [Gammaproteobacteria bacterium]|nr:BCCT family transporter [Gammaproteobacteria bacterium]
LAESSVQNQMLLVGAITLAATASAASGLNKGIRRLSQLNMVLALALLATVFIAGPTVFLLSSYVQNIGSYAASLVELSFNTDAYIGIEWQEAWTMFYWGWWISWSPFVGMFIARISRGRTIREFIAGVLLAPSLTIFFWMVVFGNTAINFELAGDGGLVEAVHADIATVIFVLFEQLPFSTIMTMTAIVVIAIFFVTSADSGSLVVNILTAGGDPEPPAYRRGLGAVMIGAVAAVLLLTGGLTALQTAAVTTAAPFSIVMLLVCYALVKALRAEGSLRAAADAGAPRTGAAAEPAGTATSAPLAAATPATGYTGAPPLPLAAAERHEDWRKRLKTVVWGYDRHMRRLEAQQAAALPQIRRLLDETVLPAFDELKAQLEENGREVYIRTDGDWATLTTARDGEQEFALTVRGVVREPLTFALTDLATDPEEARPRVEIIVPTGRVGAWPLEEFSAETIFDEFVAAYARWMGW